MPERESVQAKLTVTLLLFQPAELGAGRTPAAIAGGVLSMLTLTVIVAVFPALFVAVPCTAWLAPCVVSVTGAVQLLIPEN